MSHSLQIRKAQTIAILYIMSANYSLALAKIGKSYYIHNKTVLLFLFSLDFGNP